MCGTPDPGTDPTDPHDRSRERYAEQTTKMRRPDQTANRRARRENGAACAAAAGTWASSGRSTHNTR